MKIAAMKNILVLMINHGVIIYRISSSTILFLHVQSYHIPAQYLGYTAQRIIFLHFIFKNFVFDIGRVVQML